MVKNIEEYRFLDNLLNPQLQPDYKQYQQPQIIPRWSLQASVCNISSQKRKLQQEAQRAAVALWDKQRHLWGKNKGQLCTQGEQARGRGQPHRRHTVVGQDCTVSEHSRQSQELPAGSINKVRQDWRKCCNMGLKTTQKPQLTDITGGKL